ncbi:MAG: hydroxyacylglutathione hydrolase [Frankiales bacterium]|nr:hydroxyacylglutathione hydrolase [Frankiales bacterium]
MLVRGFPAAAFDTNCWVVAPAAGEECVVIDPGIGVEATLDEVLRQDNLRPVAVLLTHGHLDHTFSVTPVCGAKGIPAWIHPGDRELLADPMKGLSPESRTMFGGRLEWTEPDDIALLDPAAPLELAGLRFGVDFAPGHTPGSVVFRTPGVDVGGEAAAPVMFSGDVLFAGSIGRTDLPGGSWEQMQESLARVVLTAPDDTIVHCGHGSSTTIGRERTANPYLQDLVGLGETAPPTRGL